MKVNKITIVVKDGRVESIYGTDANVVIDIIDMDTQNEEELQDLEKELEEVKKTEIELL